MVTTANKLPIWRAVFDSQLSRKVAIAVFASIVIVEAAILLPSYMNYQRDLLDRLNEVERTALVSSYLLMAHGSPRNLLITGKILAHHTNLRGGALYAPDGSYIGGFGETPELTPAMAGRDHMTEQLLARRTRFETLWPMAETGLPLTVVGRIDSSRINADLKAFLWRIAGLVVLLSVLVGASTLFIVGKLTLMPLLKIRDSLHKASWDPSHAERYGLPTIWSREINDAILALNSLLRRLSKTHREELAMFASMVTDANEALMVEDGDGQLIYANAACLDLCGFASVDDMRRAAVPLFIPAGARHPVSLRQCLDISDLATEVTVIGASGKQISCTLGTSTLIDESGDKPPRYVAHITNITALSRSEAKFRNLIEGSVQGMLIHRAGRIVYANETMADTFGYTVAEFIGMAVRKLVPPGEWERLSVYRAQEMTEQFENRALRKDGGSMWLRCIAHDIEWDGEPSRQLTIVDITKHKAAENQLHQSQKMEAVGQLTGGLAHDFGNLLTIMMGNLELLEERLADDRALLPLVRPARHAAQRGIELTERLLLFAHKQELLPRTVDAGSLVRDLRDMLQRSLGSNIEIEVATSDQLWPTVADPGELENALLNLAVNARDAMPEGGKLSISTENVVVREKYAGDAGLKPGQYVMVAVRDTGMGMAQEVAEKIFQPFFTTKGQDKGTGLGLAMVYGFVQQSGGFVSVDSEPGRGTIIKIFLPRETGAAPALEKSA